MPGAGDKRYTWMRAFDPAYHRAGSASSGSMRNCFSYTTLLVTGGRGFYNPSNTAKEAAVLLS